MFYLLRVILLSIVIDHARSSSSLARLAYGKPQLV